LLTIGQRTDSAQKNRPEQLNDGYQGCGEAIQREKAPRPNSTTAITRNRTDSVIWISFALAASPNGRCCAALLGRTLFGDNFGDAFHQGVLRFPGRRGELGELTGHCVDCRVEVADLFRELIHFGIRRIVARVLRFFRSRRDKR
jgi:hypothetical protein